MLYWWFIFLRFALIDTRHFNGGTIRWAPINPYENASSITISLIQTYYWTFPDVKCANDVPISTGAYSAGSDNVICMADCAYDGGYSTKPVSILTDCISSSSAVGVMKSERTVNVTLNDTAHFYASYVGAAWRNLNSPIIAGLEWSITTYINLRRRPDGSINTPPTAHLVSPQYTIVNRITQIEIPVSDANPGDYIRCRWSKYFDGYRRRRRGAKPIELDQAEWTRKKRLALPTMNCTSSCLQGCLCNETSCLETNCYGQTCTIYPSCFIESTSMLTMTDTFTEESTTSTTSTTSRTTRSFPNRQPVDECGGICYPNTLPTSTTLSNCTLSFQGLIPNTWYAVAIQVEDFIDYTNTTPMSSIPVQFLIYVMPEPSCPKMPEIVPMQDCPEIMVGTQRILNVIVYNPCNTSTTSIQDVIISKSVAGIQAGKMINSSYNSSITYKIFTWTPVPAQMGPQELCFVAYSSDQIQSNEYCVTYFIKDSWINCTTTTTTTSTTSTSTTSTSTSSTTSTTSTTTSTTSTTSSTSTTSTTTTSSSTSSSTSSTSTTTTTSSSTSTTSVTTTTSTSTTTTSVTTVTETETSTTISSEKPPSWGLIAGLSSLVLPLGLCGACCLYRLLWSPSARRRKQDDDEENDDKNNSNNQCESTTDINCSMEIPNKSYRIYNVESTEWQLESQMSMTSLLSSPSYSILDQEYHRELLAKKMLPNNFSVTNSATEEKQV